MVKSIGFIKGKSYWCGYWAKKHTIIEIHPNGDVTSLWHATKYEKEYTTTHHTCFDKRRDKEIE